MTTLEHFKSTLQNTDFFTIGDYIQSKRENRVIGWVCEDNNILVYSKKVIERVHTFRKLDAWGFNTTFINMLPSRTKIVVISEKYKYTTDIEHLLANCSESQYGGHERQYFLAKSEFAIIPIPTIKAVKL